MEALGEIVVNIWEFSDDDKTLLLSYIEDDKLRDVTVKDMRKAIKLAAVELDYPNTKNIPINRIDTHSFRAGGGKCSTPCRIHRFANTKNWVMERGHFERIC